ncbi:MAG: hypothetical protein ACRENO_09520 [Thermodesulfobacteriota bacterium]
MSLKNTDSRVIKNPDLLIAWEAALKENKKSNAAANINPLSPGGRGIKGEGLRVRGNIIITPISM